MKAETEGKMPAREITTRFQVNYEMDNFAKQLIEASIISVQDLITDAEKVTEERNGKIISCEDVEKALNIYDDDTIKAIEQTLADAKAHKKRYEQED